MNYRRLLTCAASVAAFATGGTAMAQPGDTFTSSGTATARITSPVAVAKTADLEFGTMIAPATGWARVTIHARNGSRNGNGNTVFVANNGFARGAFAVTGPANTDILITTPAPTFELTGPGAPMTVDRLRISFDDSAQRSLPRSVTIPATGAADMHVGGRLRFRAGQAPGQYSGTFLIVVTHQ